MDKLTQNKDIWNYICSFLSIQELFTKVACLNRELYYDILTNTYIIDLLISYNMGFRLHDL